MLQFSDRALETIRSAMATKTPTPTGLRLGAVGSACSGLRYIIRLEQAPDSSDQVIECQGLRLYIDPDSVAMLNGVAVDFVETDERRGFTFDNPNVSERCAGCSSSKGEGQAAGRC